MLPEGRVTERFEQYGELSHGGLDERFLKLKFNTPQSSVPNLIYRKVIAYNTRLAELQYYTVADISLSLSHSGKQHTHSTQRGNGDDL